MSGQQPPLETTAEVINFDQLLYASAPAASGPSSAFQSLSVRKIDAGVTNVINARFHRSKPNGPA